MIAPEVDPTPGGSVAFAGGSVMLVAAFDSQLKWCAGLRDELVRRGRACRVVVPNIRSALSPRQVTDAGFDHVDHVGWSDLIDLALESDVVVAALAGPQTRALVRDVCRREPDPGPVLVSGWVGVIIEKQTAGYLDRAGCDVIAVNSGDDLAYFRGVAAALDLPDTNLVLSGLPFLSARPAAPATGPIRTVLFADQPTVPDTAEARLRLYRRLVDHARRHPDREVLLKPRHQPGEDTFHQMAHHPADLLAADDLPANFTLTYEPIPRLLDRTDLLLTVSSTACLEAVDRGVRVALVTDAGVHERLGNHVFLTSGLLRSFDQIDVDDLGSPGPAWLDAWFGGRDASAGVIVADRVDQLLASGERPGRQVWRSPWFLVDPPTTLMPDERPAWMTRAWYRRVRDRGPVAGTSAYVGMLVTPPAITQAARRVRRWVAAG